MDATPSYPHFIVPDDGEDEFRLFDPEDNPGMLYQSTTLASFPNSIALHTPPITSNHLSAFTFIPRGPLNSPSNHIPSPPLFSASAKFESPGLSSGSSSTPETHSSQQLITPEITSGNRHHLVGGSPDILQSFHDTELLHPHPSSGSSSRRRRRSNGKHLSPNLHPSSAHGHHPHHGQHPYGHSQHGPHDYAAHDDRGNPRLAPSTQRNKSLERNRIAAMKCRTKRKEWVHDLEETKTELETQNSTLHLELDGLNHEASQIRAQLMAHANCNDCNIDKWIENEAKRFVIGTGERYDQMLAAAASQQMQFGDQYQHQHRNASISSSSVGVGSDFHHQPGPPSLARTASSEQQYHQSPPSTAAAVSPSFYDYDYDTMPGPGAFEIIEPQQHQHQHHRSSRNHGQNTPGAGAGTDDGTDYDGMPLAAYDRSLA
ncbi:hypothetical protein F5Y16DRAFT_398862 [Xylariaceae sp. FL0255]|nr:hypothetical protein F5Y16DRAFT_398862 [Xylariaceae sp. FL0255]